MKKTKYLLVSALSFLAVACSSSKENIPVTIQGKLDRKEVTEASIRADLQAVADSFNVGGFEFVVSKITEVQPYMVSLIPDELAWTYNTKGLGWFYLEQNDSALFAFLKAIKLDPIYTEAHNNVGHIYLLQGKFDLAIFQFKKSLELNPDYENARLNLEIAEKFKIGEMNWDDLGIMTQAKSTDDLATKVRLYTQLLNLAPYYVQIYNNLAVAEFKLGNINNAFKHLSAAIIIDPGYAMAHNNLGFIYHEYGVYEDAVKHFKIAISLQFNFYEALENLAFTYKEMGDLQNALLVTKRILEINPNRYFASKLYTDLQNQLKFSQSTVSESQE